MRAQDLDLRELLTFDPRGGPIRFAGQRALLLDAVALGLLRQELIQVLGLTGARGILTRFGYAHGWRTAETLRREIPWDSERDWKTAGGRLHTLWGLVCVEGIERDPKVGRVPFAEAIWRDSFEAEQHLLHVGVGEEPVCWTLAGFASGYLSYCNGTEIYVVEDRCRAKGDAVCHVVGDDRATWGAAIEPHLPYFQRPCLDSALDRLAADLRKVERRLAVRRRQIARDAGVDEDPSGIVARSEAMRRTLDLARRVAKVDTTILVTGESGSGKERIARLVHEESHRSSGPFVAVNCGAIPESLIESELFGHVRGAFTGAVADRHGLFEAASGGTLFLDEIGEVPPLLQVKLLRAIQEKEIRRVGEDRPRGVDVRVVAATHRPLEDEVAAGRFRHDLYYRLRVIEIRVAPLRERSEDVLPLARLFVAIAGRRNRRRIQGLSSAAAEALLRHDWPGNVRELENAIERAVVLAEHETIEVQDLPEELRSPRPAARPEAGPRTLEAVERDYVLATLRAHGGNQTRTAATLGIGTATLYRKLRRWGGIPAG